MPNFHIQSIASTQKSADETFVEIKEAASKKSRYFDLNAAYCEVDRLTQERERTAGQDADTVLSYVVYEIEPMRSDLLADQDHLDGCNYTLPYNPDKPISKRCSCKEIALFGSMCGSSGENYKADDSKWWEEEIERSELLLKEVSDAAKKDPDYKLIKYGDHIPNFSRDSEDQAKDDDKDVIEFAKKFAKESQNVKKAFDEQLSKINSHHGVKWYDGDVDDLAVLKDKAEDQPKLTKKALQSLQEFVSRSQKLEEKMKEETDARFKSEAKQARIKNAKPRKSPRR